MFRFAAAVRSVKLWIALACLLIITFMAFHYQEKRLIRTPFVQSQNDNSVHQVLENTKDRPHSSVGDKKTSVDTKLLRKMQTKPPPLRLRTKTTKTTKTTTTTTTKAPTVTIVQVPDTPTLQRMSHLELHKFYHSYINSPQVPCSAVERMGNLQDGGWEMCDDPLYRPDKRNCLVYSFGINNDFSFDDDIAEYGCEVYAFDPSMMTTQDHIRGNKIHFFRLGIGDRDNHTFYDPKGAWTLHSLKGFREKFGHKIGQRRIDIVKMDIEGHEMESLTQALKDKSLDDVRQLSFETHVSWGKSDASRLEYIKFLELLRGVYNAGFRIFATHRNHVWSGFRSELTGKERAHCHEIHTVNINLRQKPSRESRSQDNLLFRNADTQLHSLDHVGSLTQNVVHLPHQGVSFVSKNAPQFLNRGESLVKRLAPLNPVPGRALVKKMPPANPFPQKLAGMPMQEEAVLQV